MIKIARIDTPVGEMIAGTTEDGVCFLQFSDSQMLYEGYRLLIKCLSSTIAGGENEHSFLLRKELKEYFEGVRSVFSAKLVIAGTEFQKSVWHGLSGIPYGETRSYREQAEALDRPGSVRAVAHANAMNRLAIIIPCHRVTGEDGSLAGYSGKLWRKRWLLDHEKKHSGRSFDLSLFQLNDNMMSGNKNIL
jgi:AraC family transcriptional regulator of adaptative response/methylated-DNA-[protein]-cysteine methyltransferase